MNENEILQLMKEMQASFEKRLTILENKIQELENNNRSSENKQPKESSLVQYYLNKYQEKASEVRKNRIKDIESEIESLKEDQINLVEKLSIIEQDSISFNEKKNSFGEYERMIEQNQLFIENANFEYERKCSELYKEVEVYDERYNEILRLYHNTMKAFYNGDIYPNELTIKINRIIRYFNNEGYQNACELIDIVNHLDKINNNYKKDIKGYQEKIQNVQNLIQQISSEDPTLELEEIRSMVDDVNQEIARKERVYQSLTELLDNLIDEQMHTIKDVISHQELIDMSKTEIASLSEDLVYNLITKLKKADTPDNIKNSLMLRLSQITDRLAELEDVVARCNQQEKAYENGQAALETVNKNIATFEEFITKLYQVIKSNQDYRFFYDEYVAGITKMKELNNIINDLKQKNEKLREKRKNLIIDPYAKQKVLEIDENIALNEDQITQSLREINYINDSLKERSKSNEKLFKMISDKEKVESQLPLIKNKKERLVEELALQYEELQKSDLILEEYQQLLAESDEINAKLQEYNN